MQTIILKSIDEGYFFQCGICSLFPDIAVECNYCNKLYCLPCTQVVHSQEKRGCVCQLQNFVNMGPFQQYVYNRLAINCQICNEVIPLKKSKKHQIKCQNKLSNHQLSNDILDTNLSLIQSNPFQLQFILNHNENTLHLNYKYQNFLNCLKCHLFQYFKSGFQNLTEDTIIQLQSVLFKCRICQQEGSIFIMRQHHLFCEQEIVSCICGLIKKRELLTEHMQECLESEISNYENLNSQIAFTINLQQIAFNQQLKLNNYYRIIQQLTETLNSTIQPSQVPPQQYPPQYPSYPQQQYPAQYPHPNVYQQPATGYQGYPQQGYPQQPGYPQQAGYPQYQNNAYPPASYPAQQQYPQSGYQYHPQGYPPQPPQQGGQWNQQQVIIQEQVVLISTASIFIDTINQQYVYSLILYMNKLN
ncbi:hypothetical protein pb186bvf_009929 [Paramecium bursaria]